jgi:hypothetical protein
MQAGFDEIDALFKWKNGVEYRDTPDMQRRFFGFEIEEDRVLRTEPVARVMMRHVTILLGEFSRNVARDMPLMK